MQRLGQSTASSNEALQQTRSALTTSAAALAVERRCWADFFAVYRVSGP